MKTKNLLTAIAVVIFSTSVGYAQTVETALHPSGYPIINCGNMPASAYTTTPKGNTEVELKTAEANKKVYKRFAVHSTDSSISSNWSDAFTHCSDIGAGWRLPTQRELMLMWILKGQLYYHGTGFNIFSESYYWSATEVNTRNAKGMNFRYGSMENDSYKTDYVRVRCILDMI